MPDGVLGVQVGKVVTFTKPITGRDVELFAEVSGDDQPVHLNDAVAAKTRFKQRIAHGILTAGVISAAIGTKLVPGGIAIYLSQTLQFQRPVLLGDTVTARIEVTALDVERRRATLKTECTNQRNETVLSGEATVLLDAFRE